MSSFYATIIWWIKIFKVIQAIRVCKELLFHCTERYEIFALHC